MRQAYNVGNAHGASAGGTSFGLASRDFDGSDDIALGSSFTFTSAYTVTAWVKSTSTSGVRTVTGNISTSTNRCNYRICITSGNAATIGQFTTGGTFRNVVGAALPHNTWAHVCLTWDGDDLVIYMDGSATTANYTGATPDSSGMTGYIGRFTGGSGAITDRWVGLIADTRIYSRAISASEVANLAAGTDISSTGLEGWWLLNDDDVIDYSGNGNNGINNGSTYSTDGPLG